MNHRPQISPSRVKHFKPKKRLPAATPLVDIIVIDSRSHIHPDWWIRCSNSIRNQIHPKVGLIIVENRDRQNTIGQCWNTAVRASQAEFVLFVGDDDFIAPSLTTVLLDAYHRTRSRNSGIVGASCYMTVVEEPKENLKLMPSAFTGMYLRSHLLDNPFDESLKNNVDTELFDRYKAQGHHIAVCPYYFGYYYRRHPDMVSGVQRFKKSEPIRID